MPLRSMLMLLIGISGSSLAQADPKLVAKPDTLEVFICQTVPGHSGLVGADNWVDLDWAIDNSLGIPLKICTRTIVSIHDQAGDFLFPKDKPVIVDPDLSDIHDCAYFSMYLKPNFGSGYWVYKVGCPRPILDDNGNIVGYKPPDCPKDCNCINEPTDL